MLFSYDYSSGLMAETALLPPWQFSISQEALLGQSLVYLQA